METRWIVLHGQTRAKLQRVAKPCKDADTRTRYRIVLLSSERWSGRRIVKALGCSAATVSRTLDRWVAPENAAIDLVSDQKNGSHRPR